MMTQIHISRAHIYKRHHLTIFKHFPGGDVVGSYSPNAEYPSCRLMDSMSMIYERKQLRLFYQSCACRDIFVRSEEQDD